MKISKKMSFVVLKKSLLHVILLLLLIVDYIYYRLELAPLLSIGLRENIKKYISTIFIICIVFIIQRVIGTMVSWYEENVVSKTATRLDDELIPLLRRVFKIVLWIIALLLILPFYGVNINALIATLGVSSLAVALAAQDTIANIIAGFLIMVDRPFKIGDKIKIPSGEIVEVLDIGVRRSKFRSDDKAIVIVPNTDLSKNKIVNYTYGEKELYNKT